LCSITWFPALERYSGSGVPGTATVTKPPKTDKANKIMPPGGAALRRVRQFEEARGFAPLSEDSDQGDAGKKQNKKTTPVKRKQDKP
jgi:hypothetical protein